ncbi:MAG: hypothetical protein EGQ82_07065, partial [Clostridiales bacterium]|nr:hypothetical protein [Clostridiales bacterium]
METVNIKINGKDYAVEKGITVLEAARYAGIDIPTLCYNTTLIIIKNIISTNISINIKSIN